MWVDMTTDVGEVVGQLQITVEALIEETSEAIKADEISSEGAYGLEIDSKAENEDKVYYIQKLKTKTIKMTIMRCKVNLGIEIY